MQMKLKDWVTLGNLFCGMASMAALLFDRFQLASFFILFGFVFDASDGLVARLTKQFNKFGGELDNLCDMISYSIAPGFLVFYAFYFKADYPLWAAGLLGFFPIAVGTIRAARYNVRRASYPGFFVGLPRTAFALFMIALLNSALFQDLADNLNNQAIYLIPAAMVFVISYMLISTRGFISHHGPGWHGMILWGTIFFLASIPVGIIGGWLFLDDPGFIFDMLLFDLLIYMFVSDLFVPREIKVKYKAYIKEWLAQED